MNKEEILIEDFIKSNPFDFKQGIISHCRQMDKLDVFEWVAEDELKIQQLQQENKELLNKIDEISKFIKENKIKRYRPIEGEEYDEEIVLDEDDITCLERIINDEYDYENR